MQPNHVWKPGQQHENLLRSILLKYLANWPLFLILLVISAAGAFLYLRYTVPLYEIKATIIIKDGQKGQDDSKMVESLDVFDSKKIVENEIEVIQSQTLAQEVVRNLRLYAPIKEGGRIVDVLAYTSSPIQIAVRRPDSIKPVDKVYFIYLKNEKQVIINHTAYPMKQWVNTPYGELKFSANSLYQPSEEAKPLYFSLLPVTVVADGIVKGLEVSASSKLSTVVNISLKDEVPERGQAILNELIAAYNRSALADKNVLAANTLAFVEDRLRYVTHDLDSIEARLQNFKTQNKIVDINAQGAQYLQFVGDNDQKISGISMQLAMLDEVENYVTGKAGQGGIVPSTFGISDPQLSDLIKKLYDTELEYEKVKKIAPENNPILVSITNQINKLKPSILENIETQRNGLLAGRNDLTTTNSKYSYMLSTIPGKERELLEISRQQAIKNNIYTFLLQKREEAAISYASAVSDSRLVDNAQASMLPVSPNKLIVCILAVAAAFGSGIGIIAFKDLFNPNIESRAEVEQYTQIPILSELVKSESKSTIVVSENNRTLIAEQFRQLRTLLAYLIINSRKKKIMVTSSISGEGKSFVAVNLGLSLGLTNKKVVLIDLDMRRPALANIFNIANADGISQYLGEEKEIEEIIKRTDIHPNLFFIPSGPIAINPSELLLTNMLQDLFTYLEGMFDYIIIDTPPVSFVTDAIILSPLCDATLFVMREKVTPKVLVQKLDTNPAIKSLKNMAIVFNGVKGDGISKYTNGYTYGHGYIEGNKSKSKPERLSKTL